MFLYKFLKENNFQIFKFIVSGSIATGVNFLVYNLIFFIFKNIIYASILGYISGHILSFVFAKIWVFEDKSKTRVIQSFSIFSLIYFLGGIEMSFVIYFVNQIINNYQIAWLFGVFVAFLNNFLGLKMFLFKK